MPTTTTTSTPRRTAAPTDWVKCLGCDRLLYAKRLARNLAVCPECGHHNRLRARERITQLTDPGSFSSLGDDIRGWDPLEFTDLRPYADRLDEAIARTGENEAAVYGTATLAGRPVVVLVMDFAFLGGSMGAAVGEAVTRAAETAGETRTPLVLVCSSGGARMQEGVVSLLQMVKTGQALARLAESGVLTVCVLTDPTFGGVSASFAMSGDVLLVEKGASVGFAGPRVIKQTIRQELPPGFQTGEFLLSHGLVDCVVERSELRGLLARLLSLHDPRPLNPDAAHRPNGPAGSAGAGDAGRAAASRHAEADPWMIVRAARDTGRPTTLDYLRHSFDDFVELKGDRSFADDPAVVGGVARIGGRAVVVVGHQKGHDTRELVARNFGMPHPEGYRKAMRMFDYAERHDMPVVTLIDTPGAYPGLAAEERGQSTAIAATIMRCARLRVPVVAVVTGEGGSGGALAFAAGDRLLMMENSLFSVISPEGCAAILWRSPAAAPDAARALRLTAGDLLELGVADGIVAEPAGGAHVDPLQATANLRGCVLSALDEIAGLDRTELLARRYDRFRVIGLPRPVLPAQEMRSR
jgi:acetyl-CoA carboxylase carboxyl transferase subunit beta